MTSKKAFYGMSALAVLLAAFAVAVIVLGNAYLKKTSATLLDAKLEHKSLEQQQTALIKAKKDIEQYKELEVIAKTVVPQDKDQAKAVREIIQIAKDSGIDIRSISFPASTLGTKAVAPAAATGTDNAPAAVPVATAPLTQAKAVEGITGVYSLEMNIIPEASESKFVNYYQFLDFLTRLENNRRTAQVTRIKINPLSGSGDSANIDFTLAINIFVKP